MSGSKNSDSEFSDWEFIALDLEIDNVSTSTKGEVRERTTERTLGLTQRVQDQRTLL